MPNVLLASKLIIVSSLVNYNVGRNSDEEFKGAKWQEEATLNLFPDLENFLTDVLKAENLSKKAKERKDAFIKRIKDVKTRYEADLCNYCWPEYVSDPMLI